MPFSAYQARSADVPSQLLACSSVEEWAECNNDGLARTRMNAAPTRAAVRRSEEPCLTYMTRSGDAKHAGHLGAGYRAATFRSRSARHGGAARCQMPVSFNCPFSWHGLMVCPLSSLSISSLPHFGPPTSAADCITSDPDRATHAEIGRRPTPTSTPVRRRCGARQRMCLTVSISSNDTYYQNNNG